MWKITPGPELYGLLEAAGCAFFIVFAGVSLYRKRVPLGAASIDLAVRPKAYWAAVTACCGAVLLAGVAAVLS